ncbi:YwqI/YxiC family protein [Sporosarcina sp.]|uniref:YwqI/YxiC family protein n=1 Tax=Sporosarcina sp. TaxID=49982 RepID=UPI0026045FB0|nr:YwqI/YxiC family protein [Sporosarcina sp.]
MSTEMKIVYADVENQLSEMQGAIEALDPKAAPPITGNALDVVTKLTELSTQLESLLASYQKLLINNIQTTEKSVQFIRESDEKVAAGVSAAASGRGSAMK